jgi:cyclic pyranopterin phosphate synthase
MAKRDVVAVRFIELMPVGQAVGFEFVGTDALKAVLSSRFGTPEPCDGIGNGPAEYVRFPGFAGKIGFIHAMSHAFCDGCNRMRLTADGRFMPCLGRADFTDVKRLLRNGVSDETLTEHIKQTIAAKPAHHGFWEESGPSTRDMNAIGG